MTTNWFTRIESFLLTNVLKIVMPLLGITDFCHFHELAVKCMGIFTSEQKLDVDLILVKIIFNPTTYPMETLFNNLNIGNRINLQHVVDTLPDISSMYRDVLNLRNVRTYFI